MLKIKILRLLLQSDQRQLKEATHLAIYVSFQDNNENVVFQTNLLFTQMKQDGRKQEQTFIATDNSLESHISPLTIICKKDKNPKHKCFLTVVLYKEVSDQGNDQAYKALSRTTSKILLDKLPDDGFFEHTIYASQNSSKDDDRLEILFSIDSKYKISKLQLLSVSQLRILAEQLQIPLTNMEAFIFSKIKATLLTTNGLTSTIFGFTDDQMFEQFSDCQQIIGQSPTLSIPVEGNADSFAFFNISLHEIDFPEMSQDYTIANIKINIGNIPFSDYPQQMQVDVQCSLPDILIDFIMLLRYIEIETKTGIAHKDSLMLFLNLLHFFDDIAAENNQKNFFDPCEKLFTSQYFSAKAGKAIRKQLESSIKQCAVNNKMLSQLKSKLKDFTVSVQFLIWKTTPQQTEIKQLPATTRLDLTSHKRNINFPEQNILLVLSNNCSSELWQIHKGLCLLQPVEYSEGLNKQYIVQFCIHDAQELPFLSQVQELSVPLMEMRKYNSKLEFGYTVPFSYAILHKSGSYQPPLINLIQLGFTLLSVLPHLRNQKFYDKFDCGYIQAINSDETNDALICKWLSKCYLHVFLYDPFTLHLQAFGKKHFSWLLRHLKDSFLKETEIQFDFELNIGRLYCIALGLPLVNVITDDMLSEMTIDAQLFNARDRDELKQNKDNLVSQFFATAENQLIGKPPTPINQYKSVQPSFLGFSCLQETIDGRVEANPDYQFKAKQIQLQKNQFNIDGENNRFYRDYQVQNKIFDTNSVDIQTTRFEILRVQQQIQQLQMQKKTQLSQHSISLPDVFLQQHLTVGRRMWLEQNLNMKCLINQNHNTAIKMIQNNCSSEFLSKLIVTLLQSYNQIDSFVDDNICQFESLLNDLEIKLGLNATFSDSKIMDSQHVRLAVQQPKLQQPKIIKQIIFDKQLNDELEKARDRIKHYKK